ncbi:MAG: type II toxin-antitoxin system HicA family toxin [Acidobacteriia bacterium]|nr:type II toxin-antitoxin system HicA family toxin [Terriglobia bacterium]
MKLPRDLSGQELAHLLQKFGYEVSRQTGSHLRLTSNRKGHQHHVTVPAHHQLKLGTLSTILSEVAIYLESTKEQVAKELFGG